MSEDTNRLASGNSPTRAKGWQPPSTEELQQLLPQYEITALLGRGGMGAVYKGMQKSLERAVAIKILPPGMDEDNDEAQFAERFKNEARAMARLSHPGIVAVYDSGETSDGLLYIVMEFIEGTDVQKMVSEQKRLHSEHAMAITAHVCDALQYAHDRNIIHRDIKPANIMVGYDGVVKVADFGLAKMSKAGESGLTRSGMAMGTLHYMAPEALMLGSSVDHRADIYAVGVMLYYMLTGRLPQGMFELPSLQVPGLDPRYDSIIAKALRDDRELRYQTTAELRRELDGILTQPVVKVEPDAIAAQPALPTEVRPQRPEGQRPPPRLKQQADVRVERQSSPLLWAAVIVMSGLAGWLWWDSQTANKAVVTPDEPPADTSASASSTTSAPQAPTMATVTTTPDSDKASKPETPGVVSSLNPVMPSSTTVPTEATTTPKTPATTGWRSLLDEKPELTAKLGISAPVNGWRTMRQGFFPLIEAPHAAIRLKARAHLVLITRWSESPIDGKHGYRTSVSGPPGSSARLASAWITGAATANGKTGPSTHTPYGSQPVLPFNAGQEYELELRSFGDRVTVLVNGKIENEFTNIALPGQWFAIANGSTSEFRALEWMPLDAEGRPLPATTITTNAAPSPERQALEQQYLAAIERQVTPAVTAYARSIIPSYNGALDRASKSPTTSSTDAAALKTEIQRLITTNSVPDTDAARTPQIIASLRATYRKAVERFRAEKIAPLKAIYDQQVAALTSANNTPATVNAATSAQTVSTPFTNTLGMKFVPVPGTTIQMCVHETRKQDYAAFARLNRGISAAWQAPEVNGLPVSTADDHPVVGASWEEAKAFCVWLSDKEKRLYRLPTEQEWNAAVSGGTTTEPLYPWGDYWPPVKGDGNYADITWRQKSTSQSFISGYDDGHAATAPVMSFKPNKLGIFDLGGNVFEYCSDWYDATQTQCVVRGASWQQSGQPMMLSAFRGHTSTNSHFFVHGFRVVTESASSPKPATNVAPSASPAATPIQATKDAPFTNTLGMKFVPVPDTQVLFCIHETRNTDYASYAATDPAVNSLWKNLTHQGVAIGQGNEQPVMGVSYEDAVAFYSWLSDKEGRRYRLPTDREWSFAVGIGHLEKATLSPDSLHGGIPNEYPWGSQWPPPSGAGNYPDITTNQKFPDVRAMAAYDDKYADTAPVMSFKPNKLGIYDLGGNVWEICSDWYNAKQETRVTRGASWIFGGPQLCLSSTRNGRKPDTRINGTGFRVVVETTP